ncbi:Threonine/homoserine exporter RhtA [compost metagenome]
MALMRLSALATTRWLPVAAVFGSIVSLCIGSSYAKSLFPALGPSGTTVVRLALAAAVLWIFWRPWRWPLTARDAGRIALYGAVLGSMNLLFYLAIARIPLGLAIAIEFSGPLALAIAASRRAWDFVWIGFALVGLGLLLPLTPNVASLDPWGVGFALAAAVMWALYIITGQRTGNVPSGQATSLGLAMAALVVLPFGAGEAHAVWANPGLLAAGMIVAILSSAIPYSLEMVALKRLPKQTFGILLSLEPVVGALAAMAVIGETLTPIQWGAIASIVVASAGSAMGVPDAAPREAPRPASASE